MPVSRCARGQFQPGPHDGRRQNDRNAELMHRHAGEPHEYGQIEGEVERQRDPAEARGPMRQPQPMERRHPEREAPRRSSTAYGRRPSSFLRRINHTQGTGAIQASGPKSSGGRAAQSSAAPRKAGIHEEHEEREGMRGKLKGIHSSVSRGDYLGRILFRLRIRRAFRVLHFVLQQQFRQRRPPIRECPRKIREGIHEEHEEREGTQGRIGGILSSVHVAIILVASSIVFVFVVRFASFLDRSLFPSHRTNGRRFLGPLFPLCPSSCPWCPWWIVCHFVLFLGVLRGS